MYKSFISYALYRLKLFRSREVSTSYLLSKHSDVFQLYSSQDSLNENKEQLENKENKEQLDNNEQLENKEQLEDDSTSN